jgi:hypothetical protein
MCTVKPVRILIYIITLFLFCTFDDGGDEPLTMIRIGDVSDTVSIWPHMTFLFSVPLQDSSVNLKIIPYPGTVYNNFLNETRDTLKLIVTGSLQGSTQYLITLNNAISAVNGSVLYPEEVSFEITTFPGEKEPNNNFGNADTLSVTCFGIIFPANDTDYFYINNPSATAFELKAYRGKSGYIIRDTSGSTITKDVGLEEIKTFTIPTTMSMPFFAGIFSVYDNDVRYEVSIVE